MTNAGHFGETNKYAVTDTANAFTVEGPAEARRSFFVTSDVTVHLSRESDATTDAMRVPADTPILIATFAGDEVSFVKGDGAEDGSIWFSVTDR